MHFDIDTLIFVVNAIIGFFNEPVQMNFSSKLLIGFAPAIVFGAYYGAVGSDREKRPDHWSKKVSQRVFDLISFSCWVVCALWSTYWVLETPVEQLMQYIMLYLLVGVVDIFAFLIPVMIAMYIVDLTKKVIDSVRFHREFLKVVNGRPEQG